MDADVPQCARGRRLVSEQPGAGSVWPALFVLVALTLVTQLVNLAWNAQQHFASIALSSSLVIVVATTLLAAPGLWLGGKVGLGAPLLEAIIVRRAGSRGVFLEHAGLAVALGLAMGALLLILRVALEPYLPAELPDLGHRGFVGSVLVAVSAAVTEEVWLRLGVMGIVAWLLVRALGHTEVTPPSAWPAIAIAALVFAAIHLPQLSSAGAASSLGVLGTLFGNTLVGILCGWLYWRRSLIAAILAHFATDLVLHVLPVFLPLNT